MGNPIVALFFEDRIQFLDTRTLQKTETTCYSLVQSSVYSGQILGCLMEFGVTLFRLPGADLNYDLNGIHCTSIKLPNISSGILLRVQEHWLVWNLLAPQNVLISD